MRCLKTLIAKKQLKVLAIASTNIFFQTLQSRHRHALARLPCAQTRKLVEKVTRLHTHPWTSTPHRHNHASSFQNRHPTLKSYPCTALKWKRRSPPNHDDQSINRVQFC